MSSTPPPTSAPFAKMIDTPPSTYLLPKPPTISSDEDETHDLEYETAYKDFFDQMEKDDPNPTASRGAYPFLNSGFPAAPDSAIQLSSQRRFRSIRPSDMLYSNTNQGRFNQNARRMGGGLLTMSSSSSTTLVASLNNISAFNNNDLHTSGVVTAGEVDAQGHQAQLGGPRLNSLRMGAALPPSFYPTGVHNDSLYNNPNLPVPSGIAFYPPGHRQVVNDAEALRGFPPIPRFDKAVFVNGPTHPVDPPRIYTSYILQPVPGGSNYGVINAANLTNATPTIAPAVKRRVQNRRPDNRVWPRNKTFRRFSRLPAEIRVRIWKLAMNTRNNDCVLLAVEVSIKTTSPTQDEDSINPKPIVKDGPACVFTMQTKVKYGYQEWARGTLTKKNGERIISSLCFACYESRQVFLQALPASLPTVLGGLIHYNPENTIIQIANEDFADGTYYDRTVFRQVIPMREAIEKDFKDSLDTPIWPGKIKHLGLVNKRRINILNNFANMEIFKYLPHLENIVLLSSRVDAHGGPNQGQWDNTGEVQASQDLLDDLALRTEGYVAPRVTITNRKMTVVRAAERFKSALKKELQLDYPEQILRAPKEITAVTDFVSQ